MKFEHAVYMKSSRVCKVASSSAPFTTTVNWLACLYATAYFTDLANMSHASGTRSRNVAEVLLSCLGLRAPLNAAPPVAVGRGLALHSSHQGFLANTAFWLDLAKELEIGTQVPSSFTWFSARNLQSSLEVPGYVRAAKVLEDLHEMALERSSSIFRPTESMSFVKRLSPLRTALAQAGTPGAANALALLAHLESWDVEQDMCLALIP